ncbi:MAG: rubrerythrin family protein, partial [Treponema sp.]|nr:rubrerythrin family protein [Treponema sp.]
SKDNLQAAINGESYENSEMYPSFAKAAREEGFESIAKLFDQVSGIEKSHADYFKILLERLGSSAVVSAVSRDKWKCDKCGFLTSSNGTPANCPVCSAQGFKLF